MITMYRCIDDSNLFLQTDRIAANGQRKRANEIIELKALENRFFFSFSCEKEAQNE